jgi:hypothetical protein
VSDILLFETPDGGECRITNGAVELDEGLGTAAFLSTFGGNELDDGSDAAKPLEWWGNKEERDQSKRYRSELQAALIRLNPIPANLTRYQDAAARDLQWLLDTKSRNVRRRRRSHARAKRREDRHHDRSRRPRFPRFAEVDER